MAKVIYSPLISSLRGKVADAVFAVWKGIAYVRERVIPANPRSDLQVAQREALANTLTMWQSIASWAQQIWNTYAEGYAKSGYNRYMEDNILHVKAAEAGHITPTNPDYVKIAAMAAAAGAAGEIDCTWTNAGGVPGTDWVTVHYRKTQADAEVYAWTWDSDTDPTLETMTITGLDTGEEYEIAVHASTGPVAQASYNEMLNAG
ncbi:hypothetical protein ES703_41674 [subsurface metagenome]